MNVSKLRVVKLQEGKKVPTEKGWTVTPRPTLEEARAADPGHRQFGMVHGPVNETWLLDMDTKNGGPESLARLESIHGALPRTPKVHTRNGGFHLIFRWDDMRPIQSAAGVIAGYPGIDTRGTGGQSAIPPSDGYRWENEELEPAVAPDWLYGLLRRKELPADTSERPAGLIPRLDDAIAHAKTAPIAVKGSNGSGACFNLAQQLVRGFGLSVDQAVDVMMEHWNDRCVPPEWTDKKLRHKCQDAERSGRAAWGYRWYYGNAGEILLRCIRAYGAGGNADSWLPYRVWPDGRMQQLGANDVSIAAAFIHICEDAGLPVPAPEQARWFAGWWRTKVRSSGAFPPAIAVDDEPGPSLARVLTEEGPTPAWDEFLGRLDDPETFLAWVWMLTLPKQTRRILWVHGDGHDGKTVVTKVLAEALGEAAVTVTDADLDSRSGSSRWTVGRTFGKRLLVVDDTKMRALTRRGVLHQLTGGSRVPAEKKGVDAFDMEASVAVLITSNYRPEIGKGRADASRLLPVHVRPGPEVPDIGWAGRLTEELPALWGKARAAYERLAPVVGQPDISLSDKAREALELAGRADDELYEAELAKAGLTLDAGLTIGAGDLLRCLGLKAGSSEWKDLKVWLLAAGVTDDKTNQGRTYYGIGPRR